RLVREGDALDRALDHRRDGQEHVQDHRAPPAPWGAAALAFGSAACGVDQYAEFTLSIEP
ncbi:hypothetical protein AB0C51_24300, partial [Streptomyces pathocidini]|uniref:hypothetical protein n=1 Tax=Streptomyces pathocidini TaxID=1650571 RepID=UPI0033F641CA